MTPVQAGWIDTAAPDAGPAPCAGSGQITAPWAPARTACPTCGRLLARDPYAGTLPTHHPDADGARPLDLWSTER